MGTVSKVIICTAADQNYAPLLEGLIASIARYRARVGYDLGVLDLGDLDRAAIPGKVVEPGWDYPILKGRVPSFSRAMTARPLLPKYFPGYDVYVWLDADTWVQDWRGIAAYVNAARDYMIAITPEYDRSYVQFHGNNEDAASFRRRVYSSCFNEALAKALAVFPTINVGAFAARADSEIWGLWSTYLGEIIKASGWRFFTEQNAMNQILRARGLRSAFLPPVYNWMTHDALPMVDGNLLVEPYPPHEVIKIVHLTSREPKNKIYNLARVGGGECVRSLRYGGAVDAIVEPSSQAWAA
jgi:hypothetical protein